MSAQLYRLTAADLEFFTRDARRFERAMKGALVDNVGFPVDPKVAHSKMGDLIVAMRGIVPPEGGRIHVAMVRANYSREWSDAASAAGPDTSVGWDIQKVGDLYLPKLRGIVTRRIVLVNFGKNTQSEANLAWGAQFKPPLPPADPYSIFALAEENPTLHRMLGVSAMAVVSLVPCSFGGNQFVSHVWWYEAERGADLRLSTHGYSNRCWFAFICK